MVHLATSFCLKRLSLFDIPDSAQTVVENRLSLQGGSLGLYLTKRGHAHKWLNRFAFEKTTCIQQIGSQSNICFHKVKAGSLGG